jgi:glycosyltransferase involved in cell wall biosynthesis
MEILHTTTARNGRGQSAHRPSLSIVIEWENARLAEAQRSLRMLEQLARQLDEDAAAGSPPRAVEILVLHDPEAVDSRAVATLIDRVRPRPFWPARVRLLASGEGGYYGQKNFGARNTTSDIVLFLDSDVVPEPGWLRRLLAAFDDTEVGVVCGSTFVECASFYDRAMALFWLFPLRPASDGLEEARSFYANNVAFRRAVIAANLFPELPTFRGQCVLLAQALRRRGVRILRHTGAQVAHPPPNGLRHFVSRAVAAGHDEAVRDRVAGRSLSKRILKCLKAFGRGMRESTERIARGYREVGLSPVGGVEAWGLALAYHLCRLVGRLVVTFEPRVVRRFLPTG